MIRSFIKLQELAEYYISYPGPSSMKEKEIKNKLENHNYL